VKNGKQVPQEVLQIKFGKLNIFIKKNCMVQPKYSPEEALHRIKLMMEYDSSKTLTENKKVVEEQYVAPAAAATAAGAAIGGGTMAATAGSTFGASVIVPVMSALGVGATAAGAIVGGAAALAVLPLVYWLVTKDTGANKVKKMFEMCSSESAKIAKLPRKLQDTDLRSITDDIDDAITNDSYGFQGGTDEEKLFGAFKQLENGTASDFCALVKYYNSNSDSGDLYDDLDSDIDSESEWKQIYRPIRNCVEDSLLTLKDNTPEEQKKAQTGGYPGKGGGTKQQTPKIPSELKDAEGVKKFQDWLDKNKAGWATGFPGGKLNQAGGYGRFGPRTTKAWSSYGQEYQKGGSVQPEVTPEVSGEVQNVNVSSADF